MTSGYYIKEIYSSGGEGYDGGAAICFSKSKKKLLKYIGRTYLFKDSPEVTNWFSSENLTEEEQNSPPQYIEMARKEALKTLKKGKSVTVSICGNMCTADMTIEECPCV